MGLHRTLKENDSDAFLADFSAVEKQIIQGAPPPPPSPPSSSRTPSEQSPGVRVAFAREAQICGCCSVPGIDLHFLHGRHTRCLESEGMEQLAYAWKKLFSRVRVLERATNSSPNSFGTPFSFADFTPDIGTTLSEFEPSEVAICSAAFTQITTRAVNACSQIPVAHPPISSTSGEVLPNCKPPSSPLHLNTNSAFGDGLCHICDILSSLRFWGSLACIQSSVTGPSGLRSYFSASTPQRKIFPRQATPRSRSAMISPASEFQPKHRKNINWTFGNGLRVLSEVYIQVEVLSCHSYCQFNTPDLPGLSGSLLCSVRTLVVVSSQLSRPEKVQDMQGDREHRKGIISR
ncbi:uncharacterized protein PAC_19308 [Phialocephala subalpina]|uniref:Uncharacterized protein n=1 Tax=Phialocephala subalpina TaxID=576137 RepID=A0A1L7XWM7_9HELO|nr:uncharacterized protein PAC_19308 [Phialocephala subalpina]